MDIMKCQPKIRFTPKTSPGRFMHLSKKNVSWRVIMCIMHIYQKKYKCITHPWPLSHRVAWILRTEVLRLQRPKMHRWSWCLGLTPMRWEKVLMDNRKDWMMKLCVCVYVFFFVVGGEYISCNIDWLYVNIPYGKRWLSNKNGPENALNQDDLRCMYHLQSRSLQNGIASVDWTKCFVPWRRACLAQQRMHLTSWAADLIKQKIHREPWQLRAWSGSGTPNESSMCCFKTMRMWYQCCTTEQQAWKN